MREEDREKRRLRQLAETAGSLAPSRIGAWTTSGYVAGESWSDMSWLGRVAFVIVFVMLSAFVVLLVAVALRSGDFGAAAFVAAVVALMVCVVALGRARRRRSARGDRASGAPPAARRR